ncbi:MAG: hypothetical protein IJZ33_05790, partial [Clostridia bacterium]|nr:hypothetical protein [Clostridia bacterium]
FVLSLHPYSRFFSEKINALPKIFSIFLNFFRFLLPAPRKRKYRVKKAKTAALQVCAQNLH